jgi:hypothetical protein
MTAQGAALLAFAVAVPCLAATAWVALWVRREQAGLRQAEARYRRAVRATQRPCRAAGDHQLAPHTAGPAPRPRLRVLAGGRGTAYNWAEDGE